VLENVYCFDDGLDVSPFSLSNVGYNLGVLAEEVLEFVNALLTLSFLRILLLHHVEVKVLHHGGDHWRTVILTTCVCVSVSVFRPRREVRTTNAAQSLTHQQTDLLTNLAWR
jgi:hypothetical protein